MPVRQNGSRLGCGCIASSTTRRSKKASSAPDKMKLLFCPHCQDVLKLRFERRTCECGKSWGHYENDEDARIGGAAIPLGIGNRSLVDALEARPASGQGRPFLAFVIPVACPSVTDEGHGATLKFRGSQTKTIEMMEALLGKLDDKPCGPRD